MVAPPRAAYIGSIQLSDMSRYTVPVLELAILGLLAEEDLHGYEIKRRLETLATTASFGSVYPALGRLSRSGAVRGHTQPGRRFRAAIPMTGSLDGEAAVYRAQATRPEKRPSGKARKVYSITPLGRARLADLLADEHVDDRVFAVKIAFAGHLDGGARLDLIERRRRVLADRRVELRRHVRALDDPWRTAVLDHELDELARELAWLDDLSARSDIDSAPAAADARPHGGDTP